MRLTETDASFIYMETASGPMHISSVYVLDDEVPFEAIYKHFEARIHLVPSYRRKLVQIPFSLSHPKWIDDSDFDLANHVILEELAADSSLQDGVDRAVDLNQGILNRRIPLWKMVVIKGVPGKTLLLQQTHHALIDGASGMDLAAILYDLSPNAKHPKPPEEPWQPEPTPTAAQLIGEAMSDNFASLTKAVTQPNLSFDGDMMAKMRKAAEVFTRFMTKPAITAPFNAGMVGPKRQVRWLKKPFTEIREIRRHLGGTINDVVLAVVSESISRYLKDRGERVDNQYLRIMCPVNVRTEDLKGALGNQVSAIFPMLPAWPMEVTERLHAVVEETQRIKGDEEAQALTLMQEKMPEIPPIGMAITQLVGTALDPTALAARIPMPIMPNVGGRMPNMGINLVCTNVPGLQVPQYMCGAEVSDTIGLLVLSGNVGLSLTILSYNKQLFFNFIVEPRLMPDLDVLVEHAETVFNELLAEATQQQTTDTK